MGKDQVLPIIDGWGLLQENSRLEAVFKDLLSIDGNYHNGIWKFNNVYVSVNKIKRKCNDLELVSYLKIPVKTLVNGDNEAQHEDHINQTIQHVKRALLWLGSEKMQRQLLTAGIVRHMTGYLFSLCDQNLNELDTNGIQPGHAPALTHQYEETKDN